MTTVFLLYEMDKKTGINEVVHVTSRVEVAINFIRYNTSANRVEEWIINGPTGEKAIANFYSIEDFEESK